MAADNNVTVVGNLSRAPELRFTPSGQAVANFGVAINRRWQNKQSQEWEEEVSFFDVTAWQKLAENVAETCDKGDRVVITGRLEQRSWETQDGDKRSKVEIVADDVAPSLRWATAEITKNEREGQQASSQGRSAGRSAASNDPGPRYADEEPF
jgi:single-strand DNA-binding protein